MKNLVLFFGAMLLGLVFVYLYSHSQNIQESIYSPISNLSQKQNSSTAFSIENPPSQTLKGLILSMSGDVSWQSRTATKSATISSPVPLQQGERIETGNKSALKITFSKIVDININGRSDIDFLQTLPTSVVFGQNDGTVEYTKSDSSLMAVKGLSLLIQPAYGQMVVSVDPKNQTVNVKVVTGLVNVAYNSLNNQTKVVKLTEGKQYIYNDETRSGKITIDN